jgi:hypothetical protein
VLGLLILIMIASFWERRRDVYLSARSLRWREHTAVAGQFETQIATATAWRWLAAIFLLVALCWFGTGTPSRAAWHDRLARN